MSRKIITKIDFSKAREIIKYFPFFAVFTPLTGLLYSIAYYQTFGIDITGYITISELLIVQFTNIFIIFAVVTLIIFFIEDLIIFSVASFWISIIVVVIFDVILAFVDDVRNFISSRLEIESPLVSIIIFYINFAYGLIYIRFNEEAKRGFVKKYLFYYLTVSVIVLSWVSGSINGEALMKKKSSYKRGLVMTNSGKQINFYSDTLFIGQNTSYVFLYIRSLKSKFIVNKSNVIYMQTD